MTATATRPLPADLLYGRLLATAAQEALDGAPAPHARLRLADGTLERLPLDRWLGPVDAADAEVLERAEGPVIDLGCGPGRHAAALRLAGTGALGVDLSPVAISIARRRGAAVLVGDLFTGVPHAGRWRTALLLDGNIGIGGAPGALLRRTRELLAPGGSALVELDPSGRADVPYAGAARSVRRGQRLVRLGAGGRRRDLSAGRRVRHARRRAVRRRRPLVRRAARAMRVAPPLGPFRTGFWRSPLRSPWLTTALGTVLLLLVTVVAVTGFLSHAAYEPDLPGNAIVPRDADLPLTFFSWPTSPSWLYAVTQGLHVNVGLAAVPVLLAKLWSVIPKLFAWPPVESPAQAIERLSIALLVSSAIFEFVTGIMNAQYWYAFGFNFVIAHYYGAVIFVASLVLHVAAKSPVILRAYRTREWLKPLRDDLDPPTMTRRGLFAFVGAGSALLVVANAGQTLGGPFRSLAFLAPRREDFPVNKTAARAGVTPDMVGAAYRLRLSDAVSLSRAELLAQPQHTARLPIACVEGWTTTQEWTGVRLGDLARLAGVERPDGAFVRSLQPAGILAETSLDGDAVRDPDALLALKVNGADLSMDHGFPARIIVPALPGVHNTKWVASIEFASAA